MNYNPITALYFFFGISLLIFLIFRPKKGIYFLLKSTYHKKDKTIIEDILKFLYHNQTSNNSITTTDLTNTLNFSNSSIIESLNKMMDNELIILEKDSYKLTPNGNEYALQIIRAHRLWEKYLSEKTGFHKEEWHDRAEKKEHELSESDVNNLANLLGYPKFDPHGDPIPTRKGKMVSKRGVLLSSLKENDIGKIIHIEDEPDIIYKQILAENIHLYSIIRVIENNNTRLVFHSEGEQFVLAPIVAGNITVSVLEKTEIQEENIARLSSLKIDETAKIIGLSKECRGESRRRLLDLGFVRGASVGIDLLNPLGDPKAFLIKGTAIALREDQASKILINKISHGK
ncbi:MULTISPECIES: metal-dependent transcriptional regulator [unclassified Algibacter]|uniref:metal-dependent transcriptional regulator n=1 Tax=unclassified Algibacter TaxID=2615009 RepID=UPI00131E0146|nr:MULTISPECIES: metal-dependent transcriptional regulator [unclassified Algibacter]MCL5130476.1 metal-dependent transcriptional regulator [Algibacter sp. L4_22]